MLVYKTEEEIKLLKESNQIVSKALGEIARHIKPGITTAKIDRIAEEFIRDHQGLPAFKGYNGYPATLCTSVNSQVVHGIPSEYALRDGDIVSVDCGVIKNGWYGDSAYTFQVGEVSQEVGELLRVTKESLFLGIDQAIEGNRLGDIGSAVQNHAEHSGFSVVREMVGHGLGKHLHEEPEVPNYGRPGSGILLKTGLVICIEPMINLGKKAIFQDKDGWTIRTADDKPSAHFELAVVIRKEKAERLSTFDYIDEYLTKN